MKTQKITITSNNVIETIFYGDDESVSIEPSSNDQEASGEFIVNPL